MVEQTGNDGWDEEMNDEEDDWGIDGDGEEDYLPEDVGMLRKKSSMNDGAFGAQKVFQAGNNINQHYTIIDAKEIHIV